MTDGLLVVAMPRAGPTFGLCVASGRVVRAAPVARYATGWDGDRARLYFLARGASVTVLPDERGAGP